MLFGTLLLGVLLLSLMAWRLSEGPVDLGFLTSRLEAALNTEGAPTQIKIGGIELAWEGFHRGLDRPLDLRLSNVEVVDDTGHKRLEVPRAVAILSVPALMLGRIVPRAVELDGVRLTATRGADNNIGIDVGSLTEAADSPKPGTIDVAAGLAELMRPSSADIVPRLNGLSQLRHIRLRDLELSVVDRVLGVTWTASRTELDLIRRGGGGIDAAGSAVLALKDQLAVLTLGAATGPDLSATQVRFSLGPVVPAALGVPGLDAFDAPVSIEGSLTFSSIFALQAGAAAVRMGAGTLHAGTGTVPVKAASLTIAATPDTIAIEAASLVLPGPAGQPDTTVTATGTVHLGTLRLGAELNLGLDRVAFSDLPRLWPKGVGGGARPWVTENITDGIAHDAHIALTLDANRDFSDPILTRATGTIDGDNVTVQWLRPVPPAEHGRARLTIVDTDTIDIAIADGQQRIGGRAPIAISGGSLHIVGMAKKDQDADIVIQAHGPLADILALLKEPRLQLLSKHPIDLREPSGEAAVNLKMKVPLENAVTMDDIDIGVTGHLRQGHLTAVAAGRDLDKAELDIVADKDQLTLKGTGQIGGIPATIDGLMNFQAGKPRDVTQRIAVTAKPTVRQLAATGLDLSDVMAGEFALSAVWSQQRGGSGDVALEADLAAATVSIHPLSIQKPAGTPLKASARLRLSGNQLSGIEAIVADGTNATLRGSADIAGGRLTMLRLDRVVLGRNEVSGTVRMPQGGPMVVALSGPSLDLAPKLTEKIPPRDRSKPDPPRPAWTLTGHFGRVFLANDVVALNVDADASNDGHGLGQLRVVGETQPAGPFSVSIAGPTGARRMTAAAADAGTLLRGLNALRTMRGGTMKLSGTFNDSTPAHALTGTIEIADFRIQNAPAFGRLLQSMTLYGLVDVLQGPGLAFARLEAPFVLSDDDLDVTDARAFSPSLGMTVKGHLNLNTEIASLEGTVVPAYFFNTLLGKIPFFGGIFRSEVGGGLFAARYTIRGPLSDPSVTVNPLTMLTPGFLRGLFGNR